MESQNIKALLGMVDELDTWLDLYLAGAAEVSEAMPEILDTCYRMRGRGLSNSLSYCIECIEFHASRISAPSKPVNFNGLVDPEQLSIQLQQDISFLRTHLTHMRTVVY